MSQGQPAGRLLRGPEEDGATGLAYVEKLGCAANRADGGRIEAALEDHGWRLVESARQAKLIVVLTCGFTSEAEDFNRARLTELVRQLADTSFLLVGGCLPGITQESLDLPANSMTFGPRDVDDVLAEVGAIGSGTRKNSKVGRELVPSKPAPSDPEPTLVKVATGCGSRCSFCAIPLAAGRTRSRSPEAIVKDIQRVESSGCDWVRLTSEDFSAYGLDTGLSYVDLVEFVAESTNIKRITLDTLNPRWLKQHLTETVALLQNPLIDRRVYIPVQAGSSKVLHRMARGYTREDLERVLSTLLADVPDLRISTDFIVGFPGETDEDFEATRELLLEYNFNFVEVFAYSERQGTAALKFGGRVPEEVGRQRARILISDFLEKQMDAESVYGEAQVLSFLEKFGHLRVNSNVPVRSATEKYHEAR